MMMLKKRVGATVYLNNIVINFAKASLGLFVIIIIFAMLWSGGNLPFLEYFLWLSLILVFIYGAYVSGKKSAERNWKKENIVFMYGLTVLILSLVLSVLGITKTGGVIILLIMSVPFVTVFKLKV